MDAYLENVWQALRQDEPVTLSHRQAIALSKKLYRAWTDGEKDHTDLMEAWWTEAKRTGRKPSICERYATR